MGQASSGLLLGAAALAGGGVATTAAASLPYCPDGPGRVGLFVAAYTLTAQGDGRPRQSAGDRGTTLPWPAR
jgi:hypothetical protein